MKFVANRSFTDPDAAERKIVENRMASKRCRAVGFIASA